MPAPPARSRRRRPAEAWGKRVTHRQPARRSRPADGPPLASEKAAAVEAHPQRQHCLALCHNVQALRRDDEPLCLPGQLRRPAGQPQAAGAGGAPVAPHGHGHRDVGALPLAHGRHADLQCRGGRPRRQAGGRRAAAGCQATAAARRGRAPACGRAAAPRLGRPAGCAEGHTAGTPQIGAPAPMQLLCGARRIHVPVGAGRQGVASTSPAGQLRWRAGRSARCTASAQGQPPSNPKASPQAILTR